MDAEEIYRSLIRMAADADAAAAGTACPHRTAGDVGASLPRPSSVLPYPSARPDESRAPASQFPTLPRCRSPAAAAALTAEEGRRERDHEHSTVGRRRRRRRRGGGEGGQRGESPGAAAAARERMVRCAHSNRHRAIAGDSRPSDRQDARGPTRTRLFFPSLFVLSPSVPPSLRPELTQWRPSSPSRERRPKLSSAGLRDEFQALEEAACWTAGAGGHAHIALTS